MQFKKPELIPLIFIIAATALLLSLGIWQLKRLEVKNAMIAQIATAQMAPEQTWIGLPAKEEDALYRHVKATGTFLYDKRFYVVAQPRSGQQGFSVITPFKLPKGELVLVNRGWSPRDKETRPQNPQTIEGIVRPARGKNPLFSSILPQNQPDKNIWFYEDVKAMTAGLPPVENRFIIEQTGKDEGTFPAPNNGRISIRNDHLGYAITWFTLAFAGIIMFAIYHRKKD